MAKGAYIGVNSVARKVKNCYIGVNGVARKVKKAYIGVGGVARLFWEAVKKKYFMVTKSMTYSSSSETRDFELYSHNQETNAVSLVSNNIMSSYQNMYLVPSTENSDYICTTTKLMGDSYLSYGVTVYKKQSESSYTEYWSREIRNTVNSSNNVVQSTNCIATDLGLTSCHHTMAGARNAIITADGNYFLFATTGIDSSTNSNYSDLFIAVYKNTGSGFTYYDKIVYRNFMSTDYSANGYVKLYASNDLSTIAADVCTYYSPFYYRYLNIFHYTASSKTVTYSGYTAYDRQTTSYESYLYCSPNLRYMWWIIGTVASYAIIVGDSSVTKVSKSSGAIGALLKDDGKFMYMYQTSNDNGINVIAGYLEDPYCYEKNTGSSQWVFYQAINDVNITRAFDAMSMNIDSENDLFAIHSSYNGNWYVFSTVYNSSGYYATDNNIYTADKLVATISDTNAISLNNCFYFINE